ncbi:MAG: hypothetical protein ACR2LV_04440, partial [Solirubrobacteraceae bacterium]
MRRITRRQALGELLAGTALLAAGCAASREQGPAASGSTLVSTWSDRAGTGVLSPAGGETLLARTELGRGGGG